ncbi:MAG TPA: helix-turn-helix domain-containing protein [Thermoanaerobaculia bacterium]
MPKDDPDARLALALFSALRGWDQAGIAKAAGIAPSQISVYARGERAIPRKALEKMSVAVGFPVPLLDTLLLGLRCFRLAAEERSRARLAFTNRFWIELMVLIRDAADLVAGFSRNRPRLSRNPRRAHQ